MLLQDLFKEENKNLKVAYSIKLNEESSALEYSSPPLNLEEVGFIFQVNEEGEIDEKLLDVIINCGLKNLPTLIEVPSQLIVEEKVSVKYLIQMASNIGFFLAFLPPGHEEVKDSITISQYKEVVMQVTEEMLMR